MKTSETEKLDGAIRKSVSQDEIVRVTVEAKEVGEVVEAINELLPDLGMDEAMLGEVLEIDYTATNDKGVYDVWAAPKGSEEMAFRLLVEVRPLTYREVVKLKTTELDDQTLVVDDGAYKWLADRAAFEAAMAMPVKHDWSDNPEAEAEFYSDFCNVCQPLDRESPSRAEEAKALYHETYGSTPNWA